MTDSFFQTVEGLLPDSERLRKRLNNLTKEEMDRLDVEVLVKVRESITELDRILSKIEEPKVQVVEIKTTDAKYILSINFGDTPKREAEVQAKSTYNRLREWIKSDEPFFILSLLGETKVEFHRVED